MKELRRENSLAACFCLAVAAAFLMLCSMNSWLYPINPWTDVNIIATVGRGMFSGQMPYRDLFDHKGPLAFFIYGAGMEMVSGTYHGLYLIEALCIAGTMFIGWKTAKLYAPDLSVIWTALLCAALAGSSIYGTGGACEELAIPLMAWSLYDLLRHWRGNRPMKPRTLLLNGFLAGCILWIKFNLLAFHFVWMAAVALDVLFREKKLGRALAMCLTFLGGMALASVPWLIYFGAAGALGDLLRGYFYQNLSSYKTYFSPLKSIAYGLYFQLTYAPAHTALMVLAGLTVLLIPRRKMAIREKLTLIAMAVLTTAAMFWRMGMLYYGIALEIFTAFSMLPMEWLCGKIQSPAWRRAGRIAAVTVASAALISASISLPHIGEDRSRLPQARVAEQIRQAGEDSTLLCYGGMDMGFYIAADRLPLTRWFTQNNADRAHHYLEEQTALVEQGVPDFIVVSDPELEPNISREIYEYVDAYEDDADAGQAVYRLYRRREE